MLRNSWWAAITLSYTLNLTKGTQLRWRSSSIWSTSKEDLRIETIRTVMTQTVTMILKRKRSLRKRNPKVRRIIKRRRTPMMRTIVKIVILTIKRRKRKRRIKRRAVKKRTNKKKSHVKPNQLWWLEGSWWLHLAKRFRMVEDMLLLTQSLINMKR